MRTFFVAVLAALVAWIAAIVVGDWLTRLYHMSNLEGGRGYFVGCLVGPAGGAVGFVVGLVVSLRTHERDWGGFLRASGVALAIVAGICGVASAIGYVGADKPPKINGHQVNLEFELKIPQALGLAEPLGEINLRAGLQASRSDNVYARLDYDHVQRGDGALIITGKAYLLSAHAPRLLTVEIGTPARVVQAVGVDLPRHPRPQDEQWSGWHLATRPGELSTTLPETERVSARWRVREIVE